MHSPEQLKLAGNLLPVDHHQKDHSGHIGSEVLYDYVDTQLFLFANQPNDYADISKDSKTTILPIESLSLPEFHPHFGYRETNLNDSQAHELRLLLSELNVLVDINSKTTIQVTNQSTKPGPISDVYVKLTDRCNFSCHECVAGVGNHPGKREDLPLPLILQNLEQLVESAKATGQKNIRVKWAGGEPLLPGPLHNIVAAQDAISMLQDKSGIKINQLILTNGIRLQESARAIDMIHAQNGVHVSVSIWGIGEDNNRFRGGNDPGGFDHIIDGIREIGFMREIPYNILHVITPENADFLENVITVFLDPHSPFFQRKCGVRGHNVGFPISFATLRPQSESMHEFMSNLGYTRILDAVKGAVKIIVRMTQADMLRICYPIQFDLITPERPPRSSSCNAGINYVSLETDGRYMPCHATGATNIKSQNTLARPIVRTHNKRLDLATQLHGGVGCPMLWPDNEIESSAYADLLGAQLLVESVKIQAAQLIAKLEKARRVADYARRQSFL